MSRGNIVNSTIAYIIKNVEWSQFINDKYEEWRKDKRGNAASVTQFAKLFGADHQIIWNWMKPGSKPPRKPEYIQALVSVFGDEVYKVNGWLPKPIPNDTVSIDQLPEEDRESVEAFLRDLRDFFTRSGIDPESDDGIRRIAEISKKHGFSIDKTNE
jgi:hypothetical protein